MTPRRSSAMGAALLAACALACGGRGTTSSTPPPSPVPAGLAPGSALTVVSGLDAAPVAGAAVTIGGRVYVADAGGRVVIDERALPGTLIDVTAPDFLDRQTSLPPDPLTRLVLWPRTTPSGVDEGFTVSIVYTSATVDGPGPFGAQPMRRLPAQAQAVVVVPSSEILDDPVAHDYLAAAAARATESTRGRVRYSLARDRPAAGVVFEARIDPAENLCLRARAFTRWALRGDEITGGQIVFCSMDAARSGTAVHEMGHTFGLMHSEDPRDVMYRAFVRRRSDDFGARESDVMLLMLERRAGNRFPDSDRGASGASVGEGVIACP